MAALSAGSVTYTINNKRRLGNSKVFNTVQLVLTAGQTYPTGGIPLTLGNLGTPNALESLALEDVGTAGYVMNWNSSTNKIQLFNVNVAATAAAYALVEVASTVTPGALTIIVDALGW